MNPLSTLLGAAAMIAGITLLSVSPIPEIAFVIQFAGLGALVGLAIVYRAGQRHGPRADSHWREQIIARWTLVGATIAIVLIAGDALVS